MIILGILIGIIICAYISFGLFLGVLGALFEYSYNENVPVNHWIFYAFLWPLLFLERRD